MKSQFSETQFVVAFLHNLFSYYDSLGWRYWFTMPTQIEEYNVGYDARIRLDARVQPLYFQFKISEFLSRKNAREYSDFSGPYYRFKIWPEDRSPQHNSLVDLSKDGSFVAYSAPLFCTEKEFGCYQNDVLTHSVLVPCRGLPKNHGNERHFITYAPNCDFGYWHSEEKDISVIHESQLVEKLNFYKKYDNIISYINSIIDSNDMGEFEYYKNDNNKYLELLKKMVYKLLCQIARRFLMKYNLILILRVENKR